MGYSEDWADTVREKRFDQWRRRGGPGAASRWLLDNPRAALVVEAAVALLLAVIGWLIAKSWIVPALMFTSGVTGHQILRGERIVYRDWHSSAEEVSSE